MRDASVSVFKVSLTALPEFHWMDRKSGGLGIRSLALIN